MSRRQRCFSVRERGEGAITTRSRNKTHDGPVKRSLTRSNVLLALHVGRSHKIRFTVGHRFGDLRMTFGQNQPSSKLHLIQQTQNNYLTSNDAVSKFSTKKKLVSDHALIMKKVNKF